MPDITNNKPTRHMMNTTSPIAIFALSRNGPSEDTQCKGEEEKNGYKPFKMYPVAIQMDHTKGKVKSSIIIINYDKTRSNNIVFTTDMMTGQDV